MIRVILSIVVAGAVTGLSGLLLSLPAAVGVGVGAGTLISELLRSTHSAASRRWAIATANSAVFAAVAYVVVFWLHRGA